LAIVLSVLPITLGLWYFQSIHWLKFITIKRPDAPFHLNNKITRW
jgi:hypothetical protein